MTDDKIDRLIEQLKRVRIQSNQLQREEDHIITQLAWANSELPQARVVSVNAPMVVSCQPQPFAVDSRVVNTINIVVTGRDSNVCDYQGRITSISKHFVWVLNENQRLIQQAP